jgi:AcrR family transcriptional regulator
MRNESLKQRIFNSAWQIVEAEGMASLNVRKVSKRSSCSLGSIYNAYEDFKTLQVHINAKVLSMLYASLEKVIYNGIAEKKSLKELFRDLGMEYFQFAYSHRSLWKALFEFFPLETMPSWYASHAQEGIYALCSNLSRHFDVSESKMKKIVGYYWSSIHGVTAIFLNRKMEMVAELINPSSIASYVEYCLNGLFKIEGSLVSSDVE